jgi:uncharacterized GH25 family protein
MRKPVLAVIALAVIGAAVWWFIVRSPSRSATGTQPNAASKSVAGDQARKPGGGRDGDGGDMPMAVLVDDDPRGTLRLEGQVIDADDKPVHGATVVLSSNPPRTVTSGEDGTFAFDALVGRPYTLTARAPQGIAGPLTARLTDKSDPVVLQLRPGPKLSVTVEAGGKPVDGATVELRSSDAMRATTKGGGMATFGPVPPGGYQIAAWADGYARTLQWISIGAGDSSETLRLVPGARVSGRVVDEAGAAIAGARVTYHGASDWSQQADARLDGVDTDKDGTFTFAAIPAGSFRFSAAHPDRARGSSALVTLDGKTETRDITITLTAGAIVRGTVIDAQKQPVASARVRIGINARRGMVFEPPRQAYTDAKGTFEIKGLARRELSIVAIHETGSSQTVEIDTTRGNVEGVSLVIDVTGTIAGVVVDSAGNPIEGVQVSAGPNFREQRAMGDLSQFRLRGFPQELTDAGGRFTLTGLAPGSYMIYASRSQSRAGMAGPMARGPVGEGTVAETGAKNLRIVLQPEGGVKGKVAFADGSAPPLFTVQLGFTQQSFSGTEGAFKLDGIPPQKYDFSVRGPTFEARSLQVTIEPGKVTDLGTLTVVKGRILAGIVVVDGKPVPNATVYGGRQLFGNGTSNAANFGPMGQGTKQATTDESGHFSLSGFSAGDISIVAEQPDIGRSKAMRIPTNMSGQNELVLELQKFGSLKGTLRVSGKPSEGVIVSCQPTTTPGAIYGVASGPDGTYRYDRLAPDTYKVSATVGMPMMGMKFYSKEIAVPSGKEVTLDLSADPGAVTLEVKATAKDGSKIGVASAFLSSGVVVARTAADLGLKLAASGPSSSQWVIVRNGEAARFNELVPGNYSVCVSPFPSQVQGMAAMGYAERHSDDLPAFCEQVKIAPAPATQSMTVTVELPPLVADETGSGSGGK